MFKLFQHYYVHVFYLFIYLGFYDAFNTVQVISRRVVWRAEETSTYSSLGFCTVNCWPTASNYQLSHLRPCQESIPGLRGGRRECYHSAPVAPMFMYYWLLCQICSITFWPCSYLVEFHTSGSIYPMVVSFIRRQKSLPGNLMSSKIWCIQKVWHAWPLTGPGSETVNNSRMAVGRERCKHVSPRDNFHIRPLTLCCCCTYMLHWNTVKSLPYFNHRPHPQLLDDEFFCSWFQI